MDNARIRRLASDWLKRTLNGWQPMELINPPGKSALVFKAQKGSQIAAIKIFDPEIVDRFGVEQEEERINRELTLVGKHHQNLVQIFDGGHAEDGDLYFVVMEYVEGPNLASVLQDVPTDSIRPIISQVAAAARFLEDHGLVHRDIKPDNIVVSPDFRRAVLLDLGVIRPFRDDNGPPMTDREERVFVGTHQYGPPEFLLRQEKQDAEGFRAITMYQLGAVLHDLLTRRRIFQGSATPFARLVQAILHDVPEIDPTGNPPDAVMLANNCLVKNPELRLRIASWDDFQFPLAAADLGTAAKERVRRRRARAMYEVNSLDACDNSGDVFKRKQVLGQLSSGLAEQVRAICVDNDLPPRFVKEFPDEEGNKAVLTVIFKSSARFGLPIDFYAALRLELLDAAALVVMIEYACAVSTSELNESDFISHWLKIFGGVYEDAMVRLALESVLFPTFEKALDMNEMSGTLWITTPSPTDRQ